MKTKLLERVPVPSEKILSRIENAKAVIFDDSVGEPYLLNETGTLIWQLCDGNLKIKEIIEILCQQFEDDPSRIEKEVLDFIDKLKEKKIISLE
ncbi:MAG: PqqD family protein [Candidatus Schekmanbacteria bacterium]|nr:MAG: PqqD family protein [Candidatus Schekmanbacteria bacterium]